MRILVLAILVGCVGERVIAAEHGEATACHHCHADPHDGAGGTACEGCHTSAAWAPSTFTIAQHGSFPLEGRHADVACEGCHTEHRLVGLPRGCADCHLDRHRGKLGDDCAACHTVQGFAPVPSFDHLRTGFTLDGAHERLACADCHAGAHGRSLLLTAAATCGTCHVPSHGDLGVCTSCHATHEPSFAVARGAFDHRTTGFSLHRRHAAQACVNCHAPDAPPPSPRCASCHTDPHAGQLGVVCEDCHREDRFSLARFDHDRTGWPLRGRHFVAACTTCHTSQRWIGLTTACWDCHAMDAAAAPRAVPAHGLGRSDCGDCHNAWSFR